MSYSTSTPTNRWPTAVALLALATLTIGCQKKQSTAPSSENKTLAVPTVEVGTVRAQLVETSVSFPATIISDQTAMLMPRIEAYIDEVLVDIGDEVEAGELLVRLRAPELKKRVDQHRAKIQQIHAAKQMVVAELDVARAQLQVALAEQVLRQSERDRLERLVRTGALERQRLIEAEAAADATAAKLTKAKNGVRVVEAELLQGEAELAVEQASLAEAKALAGYLQIRAPFAGLIARRMVDAGNLVHPAAPGEDARPLLTIVKIDRLRAVVYATTDVAGRLSVGQRAIFIADDTAERPIEGKLSRTAGAYHDKTRMMRAEVDLDNRVQPALDRRPLRAGSYGEVKIVTQSATLPVVPLSALRRHGDRTSVVVVRDGVCLVTPVEVAIETEELVGIGSGVAVGDQVVLKDANSLKAEQKLSASQIEVTSW